MGRFESSVDFYRYREPYPPLFFQSVAEEMGVTGETRLLDVGTGPGSFDAVTIGRALYWLSGETAIPVLDRILAPGGWIAICGSTAASDSAVNAWNEEYRQIRNAFTTDPNETRYKPDLDQWFSSSRFRRTADIAVEHRREISVDDLVARALSFSTTSPAVLGTRQPEFEDQIRAVLEPCARRGFLEEQLRSVATIFR